MADFYGRMTDTASRLLAKFKQGTIQWVPLTQDTEYDPLVEGTPIDLDATASGVQDAYVDDLVSSSDIQVTAAVFGVVPTKGSGRLAIDGANREVIRIKQIPAAGDPVAWLIFVKG